MPAVDIGLQYYFKLNLIPLPQRGPSFGIVKNDPLFVVFVEYKKPLARNSTTELAQLKFMDFALPVFIDEDEVDDVNRAILRQLAEGWHYLAF